MIPVSLHGMHLNAAPTNCNAAASRTDIRKPSETNKMYKIIPGTLNNEKGNGVRRSSIVLSSKETIRINIVLNWTACAYMTCSNLNLGARIKSVRRLSIYS